MDFFQVRQFDFCFLSFLSFSVFKTVNMCSICAYLPLLEFINVLLKLFDFATICHKKLVNFRFCPLFKNYLLPYHLVLSMAGLTGC